MENILIDTDVVIEYLRSKDKPSTELIMLLKAEHDVFLSSISEFELFLGVKTDRHRNDLEIIFNEVDVVAFDFGCGEIAADIWKSLQLIHQHVEIKDIFIASIAINNDMWLRTFNKKHFQRIKKLKIWDQ